MIHGGEYAKKVKNSSNGTTVPRAPVKSTPWSKKQASQPAKVVTFSSSRKLSRRYSDKKNVSYLNQCFDILGKIGEGWFGEVYKVKSKDDGNLYAVKKCREAYKDKFHRSERREEVQKNELIPKHPNCLELINSWEENGFLYMQFEYCVMNLEQYCVQQGNIPESEVWKILVDVVCGLKNLHDRNMIHLDLKLENILLSPEGQWKIGDFGQLFQLNKLNQKSPIEGDSRYLAPEVLNGQFTKAADIFSLGIAILELSCNIILPSRGPLWTNLRNSILPEKETEHLSDELFEMIEMMMDPDYLRRPNVDDILNNPTVKKHNKKFAPTLMTQVMEQLLCPSRLMNRVSTFVRWILNYIFSLPQAVGRRFSLKFSTPRVRHNQHSILQGYSDSDEDVEPFHRTFESESPRLQFGTPKRSTIEAASTSSSEVDSSEKARKLKAVTRRLFSEAN